MKTTFKILSIFVLSLLAGCSNDDESKGLTNEFVVAFEKPSVSFTDSENQKQMNLVFSEEASEDGIISITYTENNLNYGTDFTTQPNAESGIIEVAYQAGTNSTFFTFNKITANPTEGEDLKSVTFTISEVTSGISQGNTESVANFAEVASLGGSFEPSVGGPNQANQVYVDLSAEKETLINREIWDLAFYSGDQFRVKLNSSLYMMAGKLETTDINSVTESDVQELQNQMAFIVEGSNQYVDDPTGNINNTAIDEVSINPELNNVYLIKMGNTVGTENPEINSAAVAGEDRGWKKIRVLQENGNYVLQYADLNATTYQSISINKTPGYNFTFFSMANHSIVNVEPEKEKWDLNFTVSTGVESLGGNTYTSYGYADYVATNVLAETNAYQVSTNTNSYQDFLFEDVIENNFELDRSIIGKNWRNTIPPNRYVFDDIFYIIKDSEGNIYKLRFTAMMNENGVRGYPEFEYSLLN